MPDISGTYSAFLWPLLWFFHPTSRVFYHNFPWYIQGLLCSLMNRLFYIFVHLFCSIKISLLQLSFESAFIEYLCTLCRLSTLYQRSLRSLPYPCFLHRSHSNQWKYDFCLQEVVVIPTCLCSVDPNSMYYQFCFLIDTYVTNDQSKIPYGLNLCKLMYQC